MCAVFPGTTYLAEWLLEKDKIKKKVGIQAMIIMQSLIFR